MPESPAAPTPPELLGTVVDPPVPLDLVVVVEEGTLDSVVPDPPLVVVDEDGVRACAEVLLL